jgi:mono/diheme cytochrome c family protein
VKLSQEEWIRLVTWIDLNGPYHDRFINKRQERPVYDLPADRQLESAIAAVHATRCQACHKPADVTRLSWIDLRQPDRSLFLIAPLAKPSGGAQKCSEVVYKDTSDADYQAVRTLVRKAVEKAWQWPRRDLESLAH